MMTKTWTGLLFGGFGTTSRWGDAALAISRLSLGTMMAVGHGWDKVFSPGGGIGPSSQMIEGVGAMGFPMPTFFAWSAALAELLGGALVAVGLLTRPAALFLVINMAVAAFVAHRGAPLFMGQGASKEPALLYLIPFFLFMVTGGGRFSLDALVRSARSRAPARPE